MGTVWPACERIFHLKYNNNSQQYVATGHKLIFKSLVFK